MKSLFFFAKKQNYLNQKFIKDSKNPVNPKKIKTIFDIFSNTPLHKQQK
jgi:hypothetical protein